MDWGTVPPGYYFYRWQVRRAGTSTWADLNVITGDQPTLNVEPADVRSGDSYRCQLRIQYTNLFWHSTTYTNAATLTVI